MLFLSPSGIAWNRLSAVRESEQQSVIIKKKCTMETKPLSIFSQEQEFAGADPSIYDPRNDPDFDTWDFGLEPIPLDKTWIDHGIS